MSGSKARYLAQIEAEQVEKWDRHDSELAAGGTGVGVRLNANRGASLVNAAATKRKHTMADMLVRRAKEAPKPTPKTTWAAEKPGMSSGAARRAALAEHSARVRAAQGQANTLHSSAKLKLIGRTGVKRVHVASSALGAAGIYAGLRGKAVDKAWTKRDVNYGAAGATGGIAAYQGGSYALKPIDRRNEAKIRESMDWSKMQREHKARYPTRGLEQGDPRWKDYFRNYPKSLPGGKMKRAMAWSHAGKTGVIATGLIATAAGMGATHVGKRESPKPALKTTISEGDAKKIVGRVGLTGPLPKGLNREQKMAHYEARYVSAGGHKASRWQHKANAAERTRVTATGAVGASGAAWLLAHRAHGGGKIASRVLKNPHPVKRAAEIGGVGAATVEASSDLYGAHARKKRSSYASAPSGVAASALRRMQAYTPNS